MQGDAVDAHSAAASHPVQTQPGTRAQASTVLLWNDSPYLIPCFHSVSLPFSSAPAHTGSWMQSALSVLHVTLLIPQTAA